MSVNFVEILGVKVNNISFTEGISEVEGWISEGVEKKYIVTPNPEFLVRAQKDNEFKEILNKADLSIPDGMGLIWASKVLGRPLKERVAGVDFMMEICKMASEKGWKIGLLGGFNGVAEKTAKILRGKYPGLKVGFIGEEWENKIKNQKSKIKNGFVMIDLLFVAFGALKQEKWIYRNLPSIPVKVAMGVGGSFDYISGIIPRAPKFMRDLGLEWLFRLIRQPWRFFRQLALLKFVFLVLREKFF